MTPEIKAALAAGQYPLPMTIEGTAAAPTNGNGNGHAANGAATPEALPAMYVAPRANAPGDAPACASCGWIMIRSGTCYRCENCGSTSGCS
jgi:ribonucleoside-diphosphate reductase alpha chain